MSKLMKCGTCGHSYSNPFSHVCRVKATPVNAKRMSNRVKRRDKKKEGR